MYHLSGATLLFAFLGTALAATAEEPVEPWRVQLPAYNDNFFYLGDIVPHAERLFGSRQFREVVSALPTPATGDGPDEALGQFQQIVGKVPTAAVIATSSSTYETVGQVSQAVLLGALANASDNESDQNRLRRDAAKLLETMKLPRLGVWIRFRDETLPVQALAIARAAIGKQAREGLEVEQGGNWIELETRVAAFAPAGLIKTVLPPFGLAESWDDPQGEKIAEHVAGLRIRARLERDGSTIWLRLGPAPPSGVARRPIPVVNSIWGPGASRVAYGQWDTTKLVEAMQPFLDTWETWRETPAGQKVAEWDDEDTIGSVRTLLRSCERAGLRGAARLDIGDRITGRLQSFGHSDTPTVSELGLLEWLPKDVGMLHLSSCDSLADWMSDQLSDSEDRMAKQSMKADLRGDEPTESMAERIEEAYYERFARLRQLVYEESHEAFAAPAAMLISPEGRVDSFSVGFSFEGETHRIAIEGVPFPEFAVIGRMRDPSKARRFFSQAWGALLNGFAAQPSGSMMKPTDLGLSVPTAVFTAPELPDADGRSIELSAAGDPQIHLFLVDEWLVLSTSKQLSEKLLAAKRGGDAERRTFSRSTASRLVGYGYFDPRQVAACYRHGSTLIAALADGDDSRASCHGLAFEVFSEHVAEPLTGLSEAAARASESFSRIEWRTRQVEGNRRTDLVLEFAE